MGSGSSTRASAAGVPERVRPPSSERLKAATTLSRRARMWGVTRAVVKGLFVHHAFDHAATMAFYFFLGTIPLLVIGGLLVGHLVERSGTDAVVAPLYRALPSVATELLRTAIADISGEHTVSLAPVSLFGFLWLTS